MMASQLLSHHHRQLQKYQTYWSEPERARQAGLSEGVVAYAVLEHAAKLAELTGDWEFVDSLTDLTPDDLVRTACRYADPAAIRARAAALFEHEALSESDLEMFDGVLVSTDVLRAVLDAAARLADTLEEPDASIVVGESLFAFDALIDFLYERPDVISVRWRAVQSPNGSVPGWLVRAKLLDDRERDPQPLAPRHREPDAQADRRLALVQTLLRATAPKCIREFRSVPLPAGQAGTPLLSRRLRGPDSRFELELLTGPEAGSIGLEFTSREQTFANMLLGYVLAAGPDGVGIAGFAVTARTEEVLYVAEAVVPAGDVDRLAGACNGITAGPVDLHGLSEADWSVVLADARSELATQRASAWQTWAAAVAGETHVPDRVRAELSALSNSN